MIAAACAGGGAPGTTEGEAATTTSTPPTTTTSTTTTTTIPPTTTTTLSEEQLAQIQFEEDVQKIKQLWRRFSDSWSASMDNGLQYITDHNHPLKDCTGQEYAESRELPDEYWIEAVIDDTTIERDDGWPLPSGPNAGTIPEGRIYITQMTFTDGAPGYSVGEQTLEAHTVIDPSGTAYFFFGCGN